MAKMLTADEVERDVAAARQLLEETEEQWHEGTADYKRLDAVKQEVAFRQGLLEAVTKREAERERQAQAEARIEKAHKDHDVLVDVYSSGLTEVTGEIEATEKQMVRFLKTIARHDTARRQAHLGVNWPALNELAPVAGVNQNQKNLDGVHTLLSIVQRAARSAGQKPPLGSYVAAHGKFPDPDAIERQLDVIARNKKVAPVAANNGSLEGSSK